MKLARDLEERIALVMKILADAKATGARIVYYGSGDSADEARVEIVAGEDVLPPDNAILCTRVVTHAGEDRGIVEDELVGIHTDILKAAGLEGYYDGDGGSGTIEIWTDGTGTLDHSCWETNSEEAEYEWQIAADESAESSEADEADEDAEDAEDKNDLEGVPFVREVVQVLRDKGWTATVEYSGGGDDGGAVSTAYVDANGAAVDEKALANVEFRDDVHGKTLPLDEAIDSILWDCIERAGHSGWENNEGGEGKLTITPDGAIKLEHRTFYDDSNSMDTVSFTFSVDAAAHLLVPPTKIDYDAITPGNTGPWAQVA